MKRLVFVGVCIFVIVMIVLCVSVIVPKKDDHQKQGVKTSKWVTTRTEFLDEEEIGNENENGNDEHKVIYEILSKGNGTNDQLFVSSNANFAIIDPYGYVVGKITGSTVKKVGASFFPGIVSSVLNDRYLFALLSTASESKYKEVILKIDVTSGDIVDSYFPDYYNGNVEKFFLCGDDLWVQYKYCIMVNHETYYFFYSENDRYDVDMIKVSDDKIQIRMLHDSHDSSKKTFIVERER